jgi:hypothetical protein
MIVDEPVKDLASEWKEAESFGLFALRALAVGLAGRSGLGQGRVLMREEERRGRDGGARSVGLFPLGSHGSFASLSATDRFSHALAPPAKPFAALSA